MIIDRTGRKYNPEYFTGRPEFLRISQDGRHEPEQMLDSARRRTKKDVPPKVTHPDLSDIDYTLDRYSPVRVSIFSTSPVSQNSGTLTTAPVSTVAGFVAP